MSLKTARAWLCGRPLARASSLAHSAVSASIRIVTSASSINSGRSGSRCRSATAAASTSRIFSEPLSRAGSGASSAVTCRPGTRSPAVMNTTLDSPNDGRTRSTCLRNAELGPITSTPWRSIRSRWVYSKYATRCSATTVLPVPGPPSITSTPGWSSRMISSCSAWIVATMSRIPSPRGALTAASRAESSETPGSAAPGRPNVSSVNSTTRRSRVWNWRRRRMFSGLAAVAT